jgi:homocysteine S-methyltransferase
LEQLWLEKLRRDEIVLIDGGTGSELKRRGVAMHAAAWSAPAALMHPEILRELHADYIRAGADIITTNTFGTSRFVLEAAGLGRDFTAINRHAVAAALEAREIAADRSVAIAGSMSCLPPRFDRTAYPDPTTEQAAYRELAKLLAASGVDLIALEMIQDGAHGAMALTAALETGLPVWLGVSARRSSVEPKKLVGFDYPDRPFGATLDALIPLGATVVNVMHTPLDAVSAALIEISQRWNGPLGVYPELGEATVVAPGSADTFAREALTWVGQGARLLGGCCGTGPEHIRALREAIGRAAEAR